MHIWLYIHVPVDLICIFFVCLKVKSLYLNVYIFMLWLSHACDSTVGMH